MPQRTLKVVVGSAPKMTRAIQVIPKRQTMAKSRSYGKVMHQIMLRTASKPPSRRHDRAEGPRKKQKGSESSSTDAKPNKNKGPTKAKGKRGKAKPSRLFNLSKLGVTNAFSDAVGSEESRNPPTFTERNKDKVLKELIASVPQEHRDIAKVDSAHLLQATRDFTGHGSCYADQNGGWIIKGMKTSLKNYQVLGAAFMRRRENSDDHPKGGLCADDMGLGKTVTMVRAEYTEARADWLTI